MKRRQLIITGICCLVVVGAGAWFMVQHYTKQQVADRLPAYILQGVNFPLYYPHKLPEGYILDKNSFSVANGIVTFYYIREGNKIILNQQARPNGFGINFLPGTTKAFTVPAGQASIVDIPERTTAGVLTAKSLILINSPAPIGLVEMQTIVNSL